MKSYIILMFDNCEGVYETSCRIDNVFSIVVNSLEKDYVECTSIIINNSISLILEGKLIDFYEIDNDNI